MASNQDMMNEQQPQANPMQAPAEVKLTVEQIKMFNEIMERFKSKRDIYNYFKFMVSE